MRKSSNTKFHILLSDWKKTTIIKWTIRLSCLCSLLCKRKEFGFGIGRSKKWMCYQHQFKSSTWQKEEKIFQVNRQENMEKIFPFISFNIITILSHSVCYKCAHYMPTIFVAAADAFLRATEYSTHRQWFYIYSPVSYKYY